MKVIAENGFMQEQYNYWSFGGTLEQVGNYQSDFKFTGKEHDQHSSFDFHYFGARYYDDRSGQFVGVDPVEGQLSTYSTFAYAANDPFMKNDPTGRWVSIEGSDSLTAIDSLNADTVTTPNLTFSRDSVTGYLQYGGTPTTNIEKKLADAIDDKNIHVRIKTGTAGGKLQKARDGTPMTVIGGTYDGNKLIKHGIIETSQLFSMSTSNDIRLIGGGSTGRTLGHEIVESYFGAFLNPNKPQYVYSQYQAAHAAALALDQNLPRITQMLLYNLLGKPNGVEITGPTGKRIIR